MKASYNWLKEFTDFASEPHELAHLLTMSGFEVEAITHTYDDTIFDINVTPNRPDCLSITGIAREISAILSLPFRLEPKKIKDQTGAGPKVEIKDPGLCRRYSARILSGVRYAPSPDWLVRRLEDHGIKSICNIVDVTNYILLETGQPLHAFDLDRLSGKRIIVEAAGAEKEFQTLDNEKRDLRKDILLIRDEEKPVALAGIMGGLNTEVTPSTTNILLESAYFVPSSVRRSSKFLGITTESSYRFERGVDIDNITMALDRASSMISELAGGQISALTDLYPSPFEQAQVRVDPEKIYSLLGIKVDLDFICGKLNDLGFKIKREGSIILVTPPSFRVDIQGDVDIAEEVARLYGYEKIPATLPDIKMQPNLTSTSQDIINNIKISMSKAGFYEVINYSFISPESLTQFRIPAEDPRCKPLLVKNPLRKEESAMRTTLLTSLISNARLNINRGERSFRFFEISRVFIPSGHKLPEEHLQASGLISNDTSSVLWQNRHESFYDMKGILENLFSDLRITQYTFNNSHGNVEAYYHPGKSCSIMINGKVAGMVGSLHPEVLNAFEIKNELVVFELYDIDQMKPSERLAYIPIPKLPYVERDIALIVSDEIKAEQVRELIIGTQSEIIESVRLFDVYKGKQVPDGYKSLAYSIRYRSFDRTLTDEEVDTLHSGIVERLKRELKAELRS